MEAAALLGWNSAPRPWATRGHLVRVLKSKQGGLMALALPDKDETAGQLPGPLPPVTIRRV